MAVEIPSRAYVAAQRGCLNVRLPYPFPDQRRPSLAVSFQKPRQKLYVRSPLFRRVSHVSSFPLGANPANSCPLTPLGFLERAATVFGDCPSVVYHDTIFTWNQTYLRCLRLASALVSLGISRRDVVSVLLPNVPAMYEVHFGVPMSGAVLNNINTLLDAHTIAILLGHSGSKLIFTDQAFLPVLQDAFRLLPPEHPAPRVILVEDPHEKFSPGPATTLTYQVFLQKGDPEFDWVRPESEWDPMVLNYTSGTTSAPKGVVLSHRAIFLITMDSLVDWAVPAHPTYLWTLPCCQCSTATAGASPGAWPSWGAPTSACAVSSRPRCTMPLLATVSPISAVHQPC